MRYVLPEKLGRTKSVRLLLLVLTLSFFWLLVVDYELGCCSFCFFFPLNFNSFYIQFYIFSKYPYPIFGYMQNFFQSYPLKNRTVHITKNRNCSQVINIRHRQNRTVLIIPKQTSYYQA